jgi:hypothetical protein
MDNPTAYCGLDCRTCPIHLATIETDETRRTVMRVSIAKTCTDYYSMQMTPQEVTDCDGCRSHTGKMFSGCVQCKIRSCAVDRKVDTCASCADFACEKLLLHFRADPSSESRLKQLREQSRCT